VLEAIERTVERSELPRISQINDPNERSPTWNQSLRIQPSKTMKYLPLVAGCKPLDPGPPALIPKRAVITILISRGKREGY
jgi:hypothetical protein